MADVATQGARRDVCAALKPRGSAGHTLFIVPPTSPGEHKFICLHPFETNTKGEEAEELRTAFCYD